VGVTAFFAAQKCRRDHGEFEIPVFGQTDKGKTMPTAQIYRMVAPVHMCPSGQKALYLLKSQGFAIEDHPMPTRAETDAFKAAHDVKTTPQVFIDGTRIGGYDDLRAHLGLAPARPTTPTYRPVIALFAMALLMAIAMQWGMHGSLTLAVIPAFIAIAMCLLALQKLRDIEAFSSTFLTYDVLGQHWVPYAYLYPFLEGLAGVLMLAMVLPWLAAPVAIFIGGIGAWSVYKAVYVEKRSLKCACVGGNSNVPLGAVSLLENVMMAGMGLWMLAGLVT
jgi:glutaredoxin